MKRYQVIWTEEVFIIDAIVYSNSTTYKIKDQDNEPIKRTFYEKELQLIVKPKKYHIEKVIRKKKERERVLIYVKWKSYPNKFNSYMFQDEIESRFTLRYLGTAEWIFTPKTRFQVSK